MAAAETWYVAFGSDCDAYWLAQPKAGPPRQCPTCGSKLDRVGWNESFYIKKKGYDLCATYDGYSIASERLVAFCHQHGIQVRSQRLPLDRRYPHPFYLFGSDTVVQVDQEASGLTLGPACETCGQLRYVLLGPKLVVSATPEPAARIHETDVHFGDGFEKGPNLVLTPAAHALIAAQRFRGFSVMPCERRDPAARR